MQYLVSLAMVMGLAGTVQAQFNPYQPYQAEPAEVRARRALLERAVAFTGPEARGFVERYKESATSALFACSRHVGKKLCEFHDNGALDQLPNPHALLATIARKGHGDEVALWAIEHSRELQNPDQLSAFVLSPLEYTLHLKDIAQGGAEIRASRLSQLPDLGMDGMTPEGKRKLYVFGGVAGLVVLFVWWKKRRQRGALQV